MKTAPDKLSGLAEFSTAPQDPSIPQHAWGRRVVALAHVYDGPAEEGARAMYLYQGEVDTINRIHGAAKPSEIGGKKTAGCIGLLNIDVIDLYDRVAIGTRVVMLS